MSNHDFASAIDSGEGQGARALPAGHHAWSVSHGAGAAAGADLAGVGLGGATALGDATTRRRPG